MRGERARQTGPSRLPALSHNARPLYARCAPSRRCFRSATFRAGERCRPRAVSRAPLCARPRAALARSLQRWACESRRRAARPVRQRMLPCRAAQVRGDARRARRSRRVRPTRTVVGRSSERRHRIEPVAATSQRPERGRKMNDRHTPRPAGRDRSESGHRRSAVRVAAGRHAPTGHLSAPRARRIRLSAGHPRRGGAFPFASRLRKGMCARAPMPRRPLFAY